MSYRRKFYGDNPAHQVLVGFDDTLRTLFATVIDLDTREQLFDMGQNRAEEQSLQAFLGRISQFCRQLNPEIQTDLYQELKLQLPHLPQPSFDS
jgi:hypothetical protein